MRSLDYFIQLIWLSTLTLLLVLSFFHQDSLILLFIGMFFLGIYHIIHFFLYSIKKLLMTNQIKEYMWVYPLLVISHIFVWWFTQSLCEEAVTLYLMPAAALAIGGYYFYSVHKINLNPSHRYYC